MYGNQEFTVAVIKFNKGMNVLFGRFCVLSDIEGWAGSIGFSVMIWERISSH